MEITDADTAERLIARFQSGSELSDEEMEVLNVYFEKAMEDVTITNDPVGPETAERGRLLKLALQWHDLLDEVYTVLPPGSEI